MNTGTPRSKKDRRMAKKTKQLQHQQQQKRELYPRLLEQRISHAQHQIQQGDFTGTISTCEPLLNSLPRRSAWRVEVLALLGLAHAMLQHYSECYDIFSEAVTINPTNAELWYNRGLACRYTSRIGQAVRDFERAVELSSNDTSEMARRFATELKVSREELQEAMQELEPGITVDQYIEREERFMQAMNLSKRKKWKEAEQAFLEVIEMGGNLPQYWGNLGVSLIMQARYEEAEAALKRALEIDPEYDLARSNLAKIPDVRRASGFAEIEVRNMAQVPDFKQTISFYKPGEGSSSPTPHTTIEKVGNALKRTGTALGKQPPRYRFFLNPYRDVRFTTCPQCGLKTRQRKFPLVINVQPKYMLALGKTCRYCVKCDLIIAHQDQLEEQLVMHFTTYNPKIIGNDYLVLGTLDKPEWRKGIIDPMTTQDMYDHLHDFKEVITFKPTYI